MKKPERYPVEMARKKIADILDGTQFRGEHAEITRRDKPAGYLVPPEWYLSITEEVEELRRKVEELSAPAAKATPPVPQDAAPSDPFSVSPEVAALPREKARDLLKDAETKNIKWSFRMRRTLGGVPPDRRPYVGVQAGVDEGLIKLPERPAGSEETSG